MGLTQRFRRPGLVAKDKVSARGAVGDVSTVSSAHNSGNRLVAINNYKREGRSDCEFADGHLRHARARHRDVDDGGEDAVEIYARSTDKALGPLCKGTDATVGTMTFSDGAIYQSVVSWALPISWPGAVYGLEVGVVGTEGVMTIDDSHRDFVVAASKPSGMGYVADSSRLVDFVGSTPAGDMALGELRGPLADETLAWLTRISTGVEDRSCDGGGRHDRLMLAKAFDLSARIKKTVTLPIAPDDARSG